MLLRGVYRSAKEYFQVIKSLNLVGGKIFYGREKLYGSLPIVLRFQLIIKGRAKTLQGVDCFLLKHMSCDICMGKKFGYI
jgi:hypothetical protein